MVPEGLRDRVEPYIERAASSISRLLPYPNLFTLSGLVFGALSGYVLMLRLYQLGALLLLISGAFDAIDGAVARVSNKVTKAGAFLDSNLDRLVELFIYLGIGIGSSGLFALSFVTFGVSIMVSYSRARAEGLSSGERPKGIELGERGVRLAVLFVFLLLGLPEIGLILVFLLALETFMERLIIYYRYLRAMA